MSVPQPQIDLLPRAIHRLQFPKIGTRLPTGNVLIVEDFRSPCTSLYNDGAATMLTYRDCDIPFAGHPTFCLDTNGINSALTTPQAQPNQAGIIAKCRLSQKPDNGRFGCEFWWRAKSANVIGNSNSIFSMSMYSRDATNFHGGRVWFNTAQANVSLQYLNSSSAFVEMFQYNMGQAVFTPDTGVTDRAGVWSYAKLIIDFLAGKYVGFQFNEVYQDLSAQSLLTAASSGTIDAVHFSVEFATNSTAQRAISIGQVVGTQE